MTHFKRQSVTAPEGLSAKLTALRTARHITRGALAKRTGIAEKYLAALEAEEIHALPGMAYARQFVTAIAKVFETEPEPLLVLLRQAGNMKREKEGGATERAFVLRPGTGAFVVTPRIVRLGAGAAIALALATLLVGKAYARLRPPEIALEFPRDNETLAAPTIILSGRTEPEATVQVNGVTVLPDESGYFKSFVDLQRGTNILRISSKKPRTGERVEYRRVVYEP